MTPVQSTACRQITCKRGQSSLDVLQLSTPPPPQQYISRSDTRVGGNCKVYEMDFHKSLFLVNRADEMIGNFIANRTDHHLHLLAGGFGDVWVLLAFAYTD